MTSHDLPAVLDGFDLNDQARFAHGFPHAVFARLRRDAPVMFHPQPGSQPGSQSGGHDGAGFWVVSRHADVLAAACDPALSSAGGGPRPSGGTHIEDARPELPGVMINMMDDPRHAAFKQALTPAVGRQALSALEPRLRAYIEGVIAGVVARGSCDLAIEVGAPIATHTVALLLGIPEADWPQYAIWTEVLMGFDDRDAGTSTPRSQKLHMDLFHYGTRLLASRRTGTGTGTGTADDLTSILARGLLAAPAAELTELERQTTFCLLGLAGNESGRNLIAHGILALIEHPAAWQALRADRSLIPGAVEEMLRWTTPTPYNRRTATRDLELRGAQIRAGDKVTLWWASANRDEDVFANPFDFDVRRQPNPHLAFGAGTHGCFGDQLARLELRLVLETVLDRIERIAPAGEIAWAPSNKHTVVRRLPVEVTGTPVRAH
jgi:cytochrome P450